MHRFIVFRLHGPLAAWGDIAVGEQRPSTLHPSKSAVLGLIAAALGIRREDDPAHANLSNGYGFAVRVDSGGTPLRDFHTAQSPKSSARLHHLQTRRDELADRHNRATVLSMRDYRADGSYTLSLHHRKTVATPTPEAITEALRRPRFTPYLGRRSCPVALPFAPDIIAADDFTAALRAYDAGTGTEKHARFLQQIGITEPARDPGYYWEDGVPAVLLPSQTTPRHDQPLSRARRQFAPRTEHYAQPGGD